MKSFGKISLSRLKSYSRLTHKKFRQSERKFLVEGVHLVEEALKSDWEVEAIVVSDHGFVKEVGSLEMWQIGRKEELFECSPAEFRKLSDTVSSQGIVAVVNAKTYSAEFFWKNLPDRSIVVALDDIADPGNAGTIIRTSDWFGVDGVMLNEDTVELYNPKVIRATMGGVFHIPIMPDVDLGLMMEDGKKHGFKIITTVPDGGKPLNKFSFPERSLIVFGNEAHGVSKKVEQLADGSITIPKYGKAESLNVAISCGIILNAVSTFKI